MDWTKPIIDDTISKMKQTLKESYQKICNQEANKMKVSYKEFTGELVRLERREKKMDLHFSSNCEIKFDALTYVYDIDIYDKEKDCKISFTDVNLGDIKFIGGNITF